MNISSYVLNIVGLYLIQIITNFGNSSPVNSLNPEIEIINGVQELGRRISHAQWARNPNDNFVMSPLSISVILNLLMLATDGNSNLELRKALNYPDYLDVEKIHQVFKDIILSLRDSKGRGQISLNTRLFSREGSEILYSYKNNSKNFYLTEIQNLDFLGSPVDATEEINNWISNCTNDKIVKSFSVPLSSDTVFVAYSLISLKAKFVNIFDITLTKKGIFNTGREQITIPMMSSIMEVPFVRDDKERVEMVALPYEGKRYSIYILKPMDNAAISKLIRVENSMSATYMDSLIDRMTTQSISVTIPRMRLSQKLELQRDFRSLGINQIFSRNSANFKKFSDKQKLFVSNIFHRVILDVREHGSVDSTLRKYMKQPTSPTETFVFNKPSLLFIRNNENGLVLFWAKVIKPEPIRS